MRLVKKKKYIYMSVTSYKRTRTHSHGTSYSLIFKFKCHETLKKSKKEKKSNIIRRQSTRKCTLYEIINIKFKNVHDISVGSTVDCRRGQLQSESGEAARAC